MMNKISVIVPVYRVEDYLNRCIESIVNQTYKNLEIILVDDGSPDNCPAICDEWAKRDNRIIVLHKENGGLSDARNAGLKIATGDYISFIDSDDWIALDFYSHLYNNLIKHNADISICKFEKTSQTISDKLHNNDNIRCISGDEALTSLINDSLSQVVWNKLYKSEIVKDILFDKGKYHEDEFWSYKPLSKAEKVVISDYIGYFYWQRDNSIMGNSYSLKRLDAIEAKIIRNKYLKENRPELLSFAKVNLAFSCLYHGQNSMIYLNKSDKKKALKFLKTAIKSISLNNCDMHGLPLLHKIWLKLSVISFKLTCMIRNMLKIGL